MSVRRENVRRTKTSAAVRLRPYRVLIVLGLLAVAGAIAFVVTWPGFAPKNVTVSGNRLIPAAEIVARARVSSHVNLWLQDPAAMERRVETIPYVAVAAVRRIPPSTVAIWVQERTPFAVVVFGTQASFVDRDLRVLGPAPAGSELPVFSLPKIAAPDAGTFLTDEDERALFDDYAALVAAHVFPRGLSYDRFGGLVATLPQGVMVFFGESTDLEKKFALVNPILAQAQRGGRRLATIDVRAPNTPVVTYR